MDTALPDKATAPDKTTSLDKATACATIIDWLHESIHKEFTARMHIPVEQQVAFNKLFPVEGAKVPFAAGIQALKYGATHGDLGAYSMGDDVSSVLNSDPWSHFHYKRCLDRLESTGLKTDDVPALYASLVEASTGFYTITPDEFDALRQKRTTWPKFSSDAKNAQNIYYGRPVKSLNAVTFDEFKQLVAQVLTEKGLPIELASGQKDKVAAQSQDQQQQQQQWGPSATIDTVSINGTVHVPSLESAYDAAVRTHKKLDGEATAAELTATQKRTDADSAAALVEKLRKELEVARPARNEGRS